IKRKTRTHKETMCYSYLVKGLVLVAIFIVIPRTSGLRCLSCQFARNVTDCFRTEAQCEDGEEQCYLRKVMLPNMQIAFIAGCKSDKVCSFDEHQIGDGKRQIEFSHGHMIDLVMCSECCTAGPNKDGVPCNGYLCGQRPTLNPDYVWCAECDRTDDPTKCSRFVQCPSNEVCSQDLYVSNQQLLYSLGCRRKQICDKTHEAYTDTHGRKRDQGTINICSSCCNTRECNQGVCNLIRQKQIYYSTNTG
ncbi:Hypothetical predicted protein, partial [Mytilus galloprovincialis]